MTGPDLDLVVPVHNEVHVLDERIRTLHEQFVTLS
jgi:hypothetical protein